MSNSRITVTARPHVDVPRAVWEALNLQIGDSIAFDIRAQEVRIRKLHPERSDKDGSAPAITQQVQASAKLADTKEPAPTATAAALSVVRTWLADAKELAPGATAAVRPSSDWQDNIVYSLALLECHQHGTIAQIDAVLSRRLGMAGPLSTQDCDAEALAKWLSSLPRSTCTHVLGTITQDDPDLAGQLRDLVFTFEDMVQIDSRGIQLILKEAQSQDLILAMKTASELIKELIYGSMSKRAAAMLREDLEVLGRVKVADVEKAQQNLVKVARKLEEEGKIIIGPRAGYVD